MDKSLFDKIKSIAGEENVATDIKMSELTSFKVGGPAAAVVYPEGVEELKNLIKFFHEESVEYMVIGNGSNLLVSDKGYDGVLIKLPASLSTVNCEGDVITADAGAMLSTVCKCALSNSLTGLEFAYGIPGTVGGAMVMNAGAYGGEMKDVVETVYAISSEGEEIVLSNSEMRFGYRTSAVSGDGFTVYRVEYRLSRDKADEIKARMDDYTGRRISKQPLEYPSAGSTFKRPEGNFAGKLIMEAGLSGERVGGACVSPKHCGFIVNDKKATARDINELIKKVIEAVKASSGVELESEVIRVGDFD